ncbi:MAG: flavodoxin-dependent (E)-4-hydroxy-3-methylbut-2-enyl-diphosphate synthase [Clostridiales bacterium]|jgi:(E)-4-hydroxy-3-methylbut-2-enyl-diphosphate synthase|nr:flavodoxin-dependent (E)-4-hydroxy-3-methylbut-2-enyl-diphosphate synthase [Clostridiales bacterium]
MDRKIVKIGKVFLGNNYPVRIQSMTNTKTKDIDATLRQIFALSKAGCDLVRVSIPDKESLTQFKKIISLCENIPIIADIHFDEQMALGAILAGASKIRLNPSNMPRKALSNIVGEARDRGTVIRIGVNRGSFHKSMAIEDLVTYTKENIDLLEKERFYNIVVSIKASDVKSTIMANRLLHNEMPYPIHIGLTEAGYGKLAEVKSSIAIGSLLSDNIGDTIRVSLTGNPIKEVDLAKDILKATGKRKNFVDIISCPTCARTEINIINIVKEINNYVSHIQKPLKIAIMGCVVNGIGEAGDADFGICAGENKSLLFIDGKRYKTIDNDSIIGELKNLIQQFIQDK